MIKKFSVMVMGVTMIFDRIAEALTIIPTETWVVISVFICASSREINRIRSA